MPHPEAVDHALRNLLRVASERNILKGKLHGGHLEHIKPKVTEPINNLMDHLEKQSSGDIGIVHRGGSLPMGGSIGVGGHMGAPGPIPKTPKEAYHWALNLTPHQLEMKREIAAQLLGAVPSPMWGNLVNKQDSLEADPEEYEKIIDMPNVHSVARMIEAEDGHSKGSGFWKALKHVAKKAHGIFKLGHHALGLANQIKDPLLELPVFSPYKDTINAALETANAFDQTINPMVDATMAAVNGDENERTRLKEAAATALENTAKQYVPQAAPYIDAAKSVKQGYDTLSAHKKKRGHKDERHEKPVETISNVQD